MKTWLAALFLCLVFLSTAAACTATQPAAEISASAGNSAPAPFGSSAPEEAPSASNEVPEPTAAWLALRELYPSKKEELVYSDTGLASRALIPRIASDLRKNAVIIGSPDEFNAQLFAFTFRFKGTQMDVYALTELFDGTKPADSLRGELLYSAVVQEERVAVLLSGFVDESLDPPQYQTPYQIVFTFGEQHASFVPTSSQTYHLDVKNLEPFVSSSDYPVGNLLEKKPEDPQSEASLVPEDLFSDSYTAADYSFSTYWGEDELIGEAQDYMRTYPRELGYTGYYDNYQIGHLFSDAFANHYFIVENLKGQSLYIMRYAAAEKEFSVVQIISDDMERDNTFLHLPASDYYLHARSQSEEGQCLVRFDGAPSAEKEPIYSREICWLSDPVVNPNNLTEQLLFGCIANDGSYPYDRENDNGFSYIVLLKRGNEIINWYLTDRFDKNSRYLNTSTIRGVIATSDQGIGRLTIPYKATFSGNTVQVYYPDSFAAFSFDFSKRTLAARVQYDESFRRKRNNHYVYSTTNGRYELWEMNRSGYSKGLSVYDTATGALLDFYNRVPAHDYWLNFVDDRTVAVMSQEEINSEAMQRYRNQIFLYDLPTMTEKELALPLDHAIGNSFMRGYAWDEYRKQHIVLSTDGYSPYRISYFSADGSFIRHQETEISRFGGKMNHDPAWLAVVEHGTLYLRDFHGSAGGFFYNMDTGAVTPGFYPAHEQSYWQHLLRTDKAAAGETISGYLYHLSTAPTGQEVYEAILSSLTYDTSQPLSRLPGTANIIFDSRTRTPPLQSSREYSRRELPVVGEQLPVIWALDENNRFFIYISGGDSLIAHPITDEGEILDNPLNISAIVPIGMHSDSENVLLKIPAAFSNGAQFEVKGNSLILSYHNKAQDMQLPFAQVVYRGGKFEPLVLWPDAPV